MTENSSKQFEPKPPILVDIATVASFVFGLAVAIATGFWQAIPIAIACWLLAAMVLRRKMWTRRQWIFAISVIAVCSVVTALISLGNRSSQSLSLPKIAVHIVDLQFGPGLQSGLTETNRSSGYLNETDNYIEVGVQVGIENLGKQPLSQVRIEFSYPKALEVDSDGTPKIDESGKSQIFEHSLGILEPGRTYKAMAQPDNVQLHVNFHHTEHCYIADDILPTCEVLTWDDTMATPQLLCEPTEHAVICAVVVPKGSVNKPLRQDFGFRVYSEGHAPTSGTLSVSLDPGEPTQTEDAGPTVIKTDKIDPDWESNRIARSFGPVQGDVLEDSKFTRRSGIQVEYRKVRDANDDIHQELYVNGVLRKVFIGKDNWVGEQITNTDSSPEPDVDKVFARFWMIDWAKQLNNG